jgi:hypothetical protein
VATRIYFARDHSLDVKQDLETLVERARDRPHAVETSTEHGEEYIINWTNVWYCVTGCAPVVGTGRRD